MAITCDFPGTTQGQHKDKILFILFIEITCIESGILSAGFQPFSVRPLSCAQGAQQVAAESMTM